MIFYPFFPLIVLKKECLIHSKALILRFTLFISVMSSSIYSPQNLMKESEICFKEKALDLNWEC